jgi:Holliday junction resolvase-like predicted endonuclease
VLQRNLRIGGGEIDLVVMVGGQRVVVEVKTTCAASSGEAIYHFDAEKQYRVRALANQVGARRVDYVGVELAAEAATVRWLPGVC